MELDAGSRLVALQEAAEGSATHTWQLVQHQWGETGLGLVRTPSVENGQAA